MGSNLLSLYNTHKSEIQESLTRKIQSTKQNSLENQADNLISIDNWEEFREKIYSHFPENVNGMKWTFNPSNNNLQDCEVFCYDAYKSRRKPLLRFTYRNVSEHNLNNFKSLFKFWGKGDKGILPVFQFSVGDSYEKYIIIKHGDRFVVEEVDFDDTDTEIEKCIPFPCSYSDFNKLMNVLDYFVEFFNNKFTMKFNPNIVKGHSLKRHEETLCSDQFWAFNRGVEKLLYGNVNESMLGKIKSSSVSDIESHADSHLCIHKVEEFQNLWENVEIDYPSNNNYEFAIEDLYGDGNKGWYMTCYYDNAFMTFDFFIVFEKEYFTVNLNGKRLKFGFDSDLNIHKRGFDRYNIPYSKFTIGFFEKLVGIIKKIVEISEDNVSDMTFVNNLGGLKESLVSRVKSSSIDDIESQVDEIVDIPWNEKFFNIIKKVGVIGIEKWRGYSLERPTWGYMYPCYIKYSGVPNRHEVVYHEIDYAHYIPKGRDMDLSKCLCLKRQNSDVYLRGIEWKAQTTIKDGEIVDKEPLMWFDFVLPQKSKSGKSCRYVDVSDSLSGLEYYYGKDGVKTIYNYCLEVYGDKLNESIVGKIKSSSNSDLDKKIDKMLFYVPNKEELRRFILKYGDDNEHFDIEFGFSTDYRGDDIEEGEEFLGTGLQTWTDTFADDNVYACWFCETEGMSVYSDFYKDLTQDEQSEIIESLNEYCERKWGRSFMDMLKDVRKEMNESMVSRVKMTSSSDIEKTAENFPVVDNFQQFYDFFRDAQKSVLKDFRRIEDYRQRVGWEFRMIDFHKTLEFGFEYQDKFENSLNIWFSDKKQFEADECFDENDNEGDGIVISHNLITEGSSSNVYKLLNSDFKVEDFECGYTWLPYDTLNMRTMNKLVQYILGLEEYCRQNCWESPITGDLDLEDGTDEDLDNCLYDIFGQIRQTKNLNESMVGRIKNTDNNEIESDVDNTLFSVNDFNEFSQLFQTMGENILQCFIVENDINRNWNYGQVEPHFTKSFAKNYIGLDFIDKNGDSVGLEIDKTDGGIVMILCKSVKQEGVNVRIDRTFSKTYLYDYEEDSIPYEVIDKKFMFNLVKFVDSFRNICLKKYSKKPIKEKGYLGLPYYEKTMLLRQFYKECMG